jgi:hypothetical protein
MIKLTPEQHEALAEIGTEHVRVLDPSTNTEYVLLRADIYERLKSLLDDTIFTSAETLDRVMAEDDHNDPHLAELQTRYAGRT